MQALLVTINTKSSIQLSAAVSEHSFFYAFYWALISTDKQYNVMSD